MKTTELKRLSELGLALTAAPTFELPNIGLGDLTALSSGRLTTIRELQSITKRKKLASEGKANPDGSFPIDSVSALKRAVRAFGRAKDKPRTKRLIVRRARGLKRPDLVPDSWGVAPKKTKAVAAAASAPADNSDGVMVAIYPPPPVADTLAGQNENDHPANELHVTLAYLGTMDEFTPEQLELARRAIASVTQNALPLEAQAQGTGTFSAPESDDPQWYAIDAPGLAELRTNVVNSLEENGIEPRTEHDFTPHMTVRYGGDTLSGVPAGGTDAWPVDAVVFVAGNDCDVFPLGHNFLPSAEESNSSSCELCGNDEEQDVHQQQDMPEWYDQKMSGELALNDSTAEFVAAPGPCSLDRSPKHNWVDENGGLPNYMCQVARGIARGARNLDSAIPIAVGRIEDWASGKGNVSAAVRARAAEAVSEWQELRARAHAKTETEKAATIADVISLSTDKLREGAIPVPVSTLYLEEGRPMALTASAAAASDWSTDYQYFWDPDTDNVYRLHSDGTAEQFGATKTAGGDQPSDGGPDTSDTQGDAASMAADPTTTNPAPDPSADTPADDSQTTWQPTDVDADTIQSFPAVDDPDTLTQIVGAAFTDGTTAANELPPESGRRFRIPIVIPEGIPSGDRRTFTKGALEFKEPPIPLLWQKETDEGHKGSVTVGKITSIRRLDGGLGNAEGVFDTHPDALEAARQVREKFLTGVSGDVDQFKAELAEGESEGEDALTIHHGRLVAATLVAKPAFQEATIELVPMEGDAPVITAAGGPLYPTRGWFANPKLDKPTRLTVTDDGHVFGHIGGWDTKHRGNPLWRMPESPSEYKNFHTGTTRTKEGDIVDTGVITLTGGHADLDMSARQAVAHYDDTRSAVADVVAGRDKFGTWVSGAMRPGISEFQLRAFNASHPSGDWRTIDGKLDLIAICQVNTPGFPVARSLVADGSQLALVAAGVAELYGEQTERRPATDELEARVAVLESRFAEQDRIAERERREQLAAAINFS